MIGSYRLSNLPSQGCLQLASQLRCGKQGKAVRYGPFGANNDPFNTKISVPCLFYKKGAWQPPGVCSGRRVSSRFLSSQLVPAHCHFCTRFELIRKDTRSTTQYSKMYSLPVFALMAVASASTMMEVGQLASHKALAAIMERQIRFCSPVSPGANLCARSCGAGYVSCVSATTCYNPGMGQTCCSNGSKWHHHLMNDQTPRGEHRADI